MNISANGIALIFGATGTTQIYEVDFSMRGVVVPAGEHEVKFRYRPWSVYVGALLTAAGVLFTAFIARWERRRAAH